jgi:serine/threonine protein kinase
VIERLGKYQISEVLGKGAMGIVYKAFDPDIQRIVALKTIRKEWVDEDQAAQLLARFRNEAQAAGRLMHPGIVAVYDFGDDGSLAYIAMEYVAGNPLREYFARGTHFAQADVVSIMVQLLDSLEHAHQQNVWHRDIKPANLIITTAGKVKVADFGIARIDNSNLTMTGAIMGTPGYMAPEQYRGGEVDWRSDIFAAGVVLYQLLTGEKPFTGTPEQAAFQICYEDPAPPSVRKAEEALEAFDRVIANALAKKPENRYQSAAEFRVALLDAHANPVSPTVSEDTVIVEPVRSNTRSEPSNPSHGASATPATPLSGPSANSSGKGTTLLVAPGWDANVLKQIDARLAPFVGPMAKVMVKRAAHATADIDLLYNALAEQLETYADRRAFLATRATINLAPGSIEQSVTRNQTRVSGTAPPSGNTVTITPEMLDSGARALAKYLGPIANMVARKAALSAVNRRHFHRILAESLAEESDRARFLRDVEK